MFEENEGIEEEILYHVRFYTGDSSFYETHVESETLAEYKRRVKGQFYIETCEEVFAPGVVKTLAWSIQK